MENELQDAATEEEKNAIISKTLRRFFERVGKPLTIARRAEYGHLPYLEDYNTTAQEIVNDVSVAYSELEHIGDFISEAFNYNQNEKTKLKNRISTLSSMATDFNLISNESENNVVYFKDSFTNYNNVDTSTSAGTVVNISTSEGIATLARLSSVDCNTRASIKIIAGNGEAGNYHIARRTQVISDDGDTIIRAKYISDDDAHDDPMAIIDNRPDTWFEYQMINASDSSKTVTRGYDIKWAKGKEYGDKLRLRIIIDLGSTQNINWINVNPYIPEKSSGTVYVYSIKTSVDGIDYESIKDNITTLNSEINRVPHTYDKDKIFVGNIQYNDKSSSQGTFCFPPRSARYIEVIMDQDQSYMETIGHTYYEKTMTKENTSVNTGSGATSIPDIKLKTINLVGTNVSHNVYIDSYNPKRDYITVDGFTYKGYDFRNVTKDITYNFTRSASATGNSVGQYLALPISQYTKDQAVIYYNSLIGSKVYEIYTGQYPGEYTAISWSGPFITRVYRSEYTIGSTDYYEVWNCNMNYIGYGAGQIHEADYSAMTLRIASEKSKSTLYNEVGKVSITPKQSLTNSNLKIDVTITPEPKEAGHYNLNEFACVLYSGFYFCGELKRQGDPIAYGVLNSTGVTSSYTDMYNELNYVFPTQFSAQLWLDEFNNSTSPVYEPENTDIAYTNQIIPNSVSITNHLHMGSMKVTSSQIYPSDGGYKIKFFGTPEGNIYIYEQGYSAIYSGTLTSGGVR
jgi:hypothetical protein